MGDLKDLSLDDLLGDTAPFNEVFPELKNGTVPYEDSSSLPKIELEKDNDYVYFTKYNGLQNYILSNEHKIYNGSKKYGLDTEFEMDTQELTILSLSFSKLPVMVINLFMMDQKIPPELSAVLEKEEFVPCGRSIGLDCTLLETQLNIKIQNRIELETLSLNHTPALGNKKGGTSLSHLTETFLGLRMPVSKSIGQLSSYKSKNLRQELQLYAAVDGYCSRMVAQKILEDLLQKPNTRECRKF